MWQEHAEFRVEYEADGTIRTLQNQTDSYAMNWAEGARRWGTVTAPEGVAVRRTHSWQGDELEERFCFTNQTARPVYFLRGDLGVYLTFNDNYQEARECLTRRCHTHIFCGGHAAWVMALRMGGAGRHLGLRLVAGSFTGYSVERDLAQRSNDRGDFILHPGIACLQPGETATVAWRLFWFDDPAGFMATLKRSRDFPVVEAPHFTWFLGEQAAGTITAAGPVDVLCNGEPLACAWEAEQDACVGRFAFPVTREGEYRLTLKTPHGEAWAVFYGSAAPERLAGQRCRFLAQNQQENSGALRGAYLIYDNEERARYYSPTPDHNAGRERVGMGCLMALWLRDHPDPALERSLDAYASFVLRELYDEQTGDAGNDIQHDQSWDRLYNYPWMAQFFLEVYRLKNDAAWLARAGRCLLRYYEKGGAHFYAIGVPGAELVQALRAQGMAEPAGQLTARLAEHAQYIAQNGLDYPPHEVNYEQSIVAPAVSILLQAWEVTGKETFLQEALRHLKVLLLFNGCQPDYHLYETAIRHWDGYWFGKRRLYGDTFPHYWSTLTGVECLRLAGIVKSGAADAAAPYETLARRAENSLRGALSLFRQDGSACCAYLYPHSVNGAPGAFADPWANDQDWALYYAYKYRAFCAPRCQNES